MIHSLLGADTFNTATTREQFILSSSNDYRGSPDEKSSFCTAYKKLNPTLNDLLGVTKSEQGSASGSLRSLTNSSAHATSHQRRPSSYFEDCPERLAFAYKFR